MKVYVALAVVGATLLLGGCRGERKTEGELAIALAGSLSLGVGPELRQAATLAVEEINRQGGIGGRRLHLQAEDDGASPERAIEVATKLRANPAIVAVVGHSGSATTLAAARIYNDAENGVVELSPSASNPSITSAGRWTFRLCPTDLVHAPALARWTYQTLRRRRAEVIYANDDYGRGLVRGFEEAFGREGGTLVGADPYLPALLAQDPRSTDPYLERAIARGMDALVVAGRDANPIIAAARRLGYDGPILGPDALSTTLTLGRDAEGVFITSPFLPDRTTEAGRAFVTAYAARYGRKPGFFGATTYDAVHLLARSLREVLRKEPDLAGRGTPALREALRRHLEGVGTRTPAFDGATGAIRFDRNGDVMRSTVDVGVVRDGALVSAQS
jgi:branched-chain amino acid transport system substrate-binding protein